MKEYIKSLNHPGKEYKPTPFWSWNDKLDPHELRTQINEMYQAGSGGYFMHARGGLLTEYLGTEWFDCVEACIDEGKKLGLDSWAYDEDGWPSGFGGGKVTALGDKYHVRWLECGVYGIDKPNGPILALYSVNTETGAYSHISMETAQNTKETTYFVCHNKNSYYIDILNPDVVKEFINCTYEEYYKQIGGSIKDGSMPGFFTDEPQYSNGHTPWSYTLPDEFSSRYGYDLTDHLICLFKDVSGAEAFRYDYWKMISELYTKSFGKQIFDWCNEHGCQWTGHAMNEDNIFAQMRCTAGVMPIYEYMHKPGIDWLGRNIASPLIPKQVSSVARQLGKKLVLTETFALCGWDVSFEELKWIAEWQFVNGVNSICQHLEGYSIRGMRKRDYPPSIFYQSPWWPEYKHFNQYFSRLGKLLADGEEIIDILVLHPMHSGWTSYTDCHNGRIQNIDSGLYYIVETLSSLHIPYHLGDETIIASHGSVEGCRFNIGNCSYSAVVLPTLETIDKSTYTLLEKFAQNGGKIISIGDFPRFIDGRPDSKLSELREKTDSLIKDDEIIIDYFTKAGLKNISVTDSEGEIKQLRICSRKIPGGKVYFIHNQNRYGSYKAFLKLKGEYNAVSLSLEDMSINRLKTRKTDDGMIVSLDFAPMQSYVILTGEDLPEVRASKSLGTVKPLELKDSWIVEKSDLNALTLDYVSYSIDGGKTFEGPFPVLHVMDRLINMRYSDKVIFKYTFEIDKNTDLSSVGDIFLVHEYSDENFKISVNSSDICRFSNSWWIDKAFKKVPVTSAIKHGTNEIVISGTFYQQKKVYDVLFGENVHETERNKLTYDTEIESVYIVGDFGVYSKSIYTEGARKALFTDGGFYISGKNTVLSHGEIVTQGYPFFRGKIILSQEADITDEGKIIFNKPFAAMAKLYINGIFVRNLLWADYETDISSYVLPGQKNKISLELIIGNRNLLGPHHHPDGECYGVAPHSFGPNGNFSLQNWRERYCFVKAGYC